MKPSVIAIATLVTFSFTTMGARATPDQQEATVIVVKDERKEIKYEDLPKEVKTSFEGSQFSNWEVSDVYEVAEEGSTKYEITITDGTQKGTITYDEDGNMIQ